MAVTLLTRCRAFSFSGKNEKGLANYVPMWEMVKLFQGKITAQTVIDEVFMLENNLIHHFSILNNI